MIDHLHSEIVLAPDMVVQVSLGGNASNVVLLDDENYRRYREGQSYTYPAGGHFTKSPAVIRAPEPGRSR